MFPFDYSASELGWKYNFNLTTLFIDCCAKIGLAYDLRKVPQSLVNNRVLRTGDIEQHRKTLKQAQTNLLANRLIQLFFATTHLWVPLLIRQWTMKS